MRTTFWFTAGLGLLLALLGAFVFGAPLIPDVLGERVDDWYRGQTVIVAVVGLAAGAVSGLLVQRRLRHQPHENAGDFLSRVAGWGFWTLILMVVLAAALTAVFAATATFIPMAALNRFLALAATGKFFGVLGAGAVMAAAGYAAVTRGANWGGRFALLAPRTPAGRSLTHGA
jgi:hypothetical protein